MARHDLERSAYNSNGLLVFLAVVGLFAWSVTSPLVDHAPRWGSLAFGLIALSASVRLAGQFLAINTVGALCSSTTSMRWVCCSALDRVRD